MKLPVLTVITALGALVLISSAFSLVTSQYRARSLVAQTEKVRIESKRLNDDASELKMEISRAALPGYISRKAVKAGMQPATSRNTILLE